MEAGRPGRPVDSTANIYNAVAGTPPDAAETQSGTSIQPPLYKKAEIVCQHAQDLATRPTAAPDRRQRSCPAPGRRTRQALSTRFPVSEVSILLEGKGIRARSGHSDVSVQHLRTRWVFVRYEHTWRRSDRTGRPECSTRTHNDGCSVTPHTRDCSSERHTRRPEISRHRHPGSR